MADNVAVTAGSGTTMAADEISDGTLGSCKVQYVKLMDGTIDGTSKAAVGANGLSVTLTTALPAGTNGIGKLTANSGVDIGDVDVTTCGTITPGTAATSLGKAEDAAHSSGDVGVMALAVRNDAGTATGADGDYVPLTVNSSGALYVTGGGGGVQYTEGDTDASITGTAALWEDTSDTLRAVSMAKPLPVQPGTSTTWVLGSGTNGIGKLTANSGVDIGDVDVTTCGTITPGTAATSLGKAEDAAHTTGDVGVLALARRIDTMASSADTSGDYATLNLNANGQLYVTPYDVIQISVTPTVSTSPAYTAKDAIGGKMTFANAVRISAYSGVVTGITVTDLASTGAAMSLVLFYTDPGSTTFTDNAALDIADGDIDKIMAVIPIANWEAFNDNSICTINNLYIPFVAGATSVYGGLVARGTPTFAGTSDIIVKLTIQRD